MTAHTPLEQALEAWNRNLAHLQRGEDALPGSGYTRQQRVDDAVALGETGVFSNSNIGLIVGLDVALVGSLTGKTDRSGGRFNPQALPVIYDLWISWARGRTFDVITVRTAVNAGVSPRMIEKLTTIPKSTLYKKLGEAS